MKFSSTVMDSRPVDSDWQQKGKLRHDQLLSRPDVGRMLELL